MKGRILGALLFAGALSWAGQQSPSLSVDQEKQELKKAVQEAGPSTIDFVRALEAHVAKYPNSPLKEQLLRALFQGSKELRDRRRIARWGSQLLALDPDDIGVLDDTGRALVSFENRQDGPELLRDGQRLEALLRKNRQDPPGESVRDRIARQSERTRMLSDAMLMQAEGLGMTGKEAQAVAAARTAFDGYPSAAAARSAGKWSAEAGRYGEAVRYYADAFALDDGTEAHERDRAHMAEFYHKTHDGDKGLGDIALAEIDRMETVAAARSMARTNSSTSKPIDFQLGGLDGRTLDLQSLRGKVVVLDFWATWCGPCRVQHPLFEKVKAHFAGDTRVVFLAVNSDEDRSAVAPFLDKQKWSKNVYFEDGLQAALGIRNIPTTVLLGVDGNVYSKMVGFNPEGYADLLTSRIEGALRAGADDAAAVQSN